MVIRLNSFCTALMLLDVCNSFVLLLLYGVQQIFYTCIKSFPLSMCFRAIPFEILRGGATGNKKIKMWVGRLREKNVWGGGVRVFPQSVSP